jgi:hypothetical protein
MEEHVVNNPTFRKSPLSSALAAAMVLGLSAPATEAGVTLVFSNNATPEPTPLPFSGGFGNSAFLQFATDSEFRLVTPYGSAVNNGHKDVFFGGESWVFDDNGDMIAVSGTPLNSGHNADRADITSGLAGFPICVSANSCTTLQQNSSFLQPNFLLSAIAPVVGTPTGNAFGQATVNTDLNAGTLTVTLPVIPIQWADTNYLPGSDPNPNPINGDKFIEGAGPGVVLSGPITVTSAPGVNPVTFDFVLHGEHSLTRDEVSIPGFTNQLLQWELHGSGTTVAVPPPLSVNIVVSGGTSQECASPGGSEIGVSTVINNLQPDDSISAISWSLDGEPAATGNSANLFFTLGTHIVDVDVTTGAGSSAANSLGVGVADTAPPALAVGFIDRKTGEPVNQLTSPNSKVRVHIDASDICDPEPAVTATAGIPVVDGELIKIRAEQGRMVFGESDDISVSAIASDASGNSTTGSATLIVP